LAGDNTYGLGGDITINPTNLNLNGADLGITSASGRAQTIFTEAGVVFKNYDFILDQYTLIQTSTGGGAFVQFGINDFSLNQTGFYIYEAGIFISDGFANLGMVYDADYSTNGSTNPLWVPNWGFIKSQLGAALTFGDGLTNTGGAVSLGDLITTRNPLYVQEGGGEFCIQSDVNYATNCIFGYGNIEIEVYDYLGTNESAGMAMDAFAVDGAYIDIYASFAGYPSVGVTISTGASIVMYDTVNSLGAQYATDYSSVGSLNPLWIPNWGFIQTQLGPALSFNNGLTSTETNAYGFGGNLTTNTTINAGTSQLKIQSPVGSGIDISGALDVVAMTANGHSDTLFSSEMTLDGYDQQVRLSLIYNSLYSGIIMLPYGMYIEDHINGAGIAYQADYSANGSTNPLWIPNWGYVQAQMPAPLSFNNGITSTGTNGYGLGGTLDSNATITTTTSSDLTIQGLGSIYLSSTDDTDIYNEGGIVVSKYGASMTKLTHSSNSQIITSVMVTDHGISVQDDTGSGGIFYNGDYEANFVPRSLATVQYITNGFASLTTGNSYSGVQLFYNNVGIQDAYLQVQDAYGNYLQMNGNRLLSNYYNTFDLGTTPGVTTGAGGFYIDSYFDTVADIITFTGGIITRMSDSAVVLWNTDIIDPTTGYIKDTELPPLYFSSSSFGGAGTSGSPFYINTLAIQTWLQSLPGYSTTNVLRGDFTWQPAVITLTTPATPSFTSATSSGVTVNWSADQYATSYELQRDTTSLFASPATIYTGSALSFTDSGLSSSSTYYYRVKAMASGYADSGFAEGSTTTPAGALTSLTSWTTLQNVTLTTDTLTYNDSTFADNGAGLATGTILASTVAQVQFQCEPFALSGEGATGALGVATNTNLYGEANMLISIERETDGTVHGRYGSSYWNTSSGALTNASGYLRIRTDGTNINAEYSTDGSTWTLGYQVTQPASLLYIQVSISGAAGGNQRIVGNIQGSGLTSY